MTKCAALYNHVNIRGGDRIYPCCRFKHSIQHFDGNVDNVLESYSYNLLRSRMLSGEKLPECTKCWKEEELGQESLRQQFNKTYTTDEIKLRYLEVGFDNICDLTCDGCWEEWSHSWFVKKNPTANPKAGITSTTEFRNIPESIEKVVFLGGEPLMTNRHRRFLESFDTLEHLEVEYFTNGMHQLRNEDIQLLNQCKHVHFTVSIDGYGKLNEKVRRGSDWITVVNTLDQISKLFDYTIHTTIHKNNWHGLPELATWTKKYSTWTTNVLTFPNKLDIINLTSLNKEQLLDILKTYNIPNSEYITAHLVNKDKSLNG
jgi:sulfatase maturation enzyme AslB (radical SAM superfamily)